MGFAGIPSRLPQVGTTIFTVMSRLAAEHGAINLSQGFPDFVVRFCFARSDETLAAAGRRLRDL